MTLTADQILAIPKDQPEKLFSQTDFHAEYKRFMKIWHPDRNGDPSADKVSARIGQLFVSAEKKNFENNWVLDGELIFTASSKKYKFKYLKMHTTDVGKMYIGHKNVAFVFDKLNNDLFTSSHRLIDGIKFQSPKFKEEFERFLPTSSYRKFNADIGSILFMDKTPDVVSLRDLIDFMPDKKLHPKHVAWIVSSTINVLAFLEHSNVCHNAITTESIFVSPKYHSIFMLGGWWFSTKSSDRIVAIPNKLRTIIPKEVLVDKRSDPLYDLYGLKAMAIECLGDPSLIGSKLLMDKNIPKPLIHWLRTPPANSAKKEYTVWTNVLKESFGDRKFFKFTTDISNIYKE